MKKNYTHAYRRSQTGFTLIELMVTLALISIVLVIGVPNLRQVIERERLSSTINNFTTSLHLARSESVKRGQPVSVCASADGSSCGAAGYEQGWIVFEETGNVGTREVSEDLISVSNAIASGLTLRGSAGLSDFITYRPNNLVSSAGDFALCMDNDTSKSRGLNILISGRVKLEAPAISCAP